MARHGVLEQLRRALVQGVVDNIESSEALDGRTADLAIRLIRSSRDPSNQERVEPEELLQQGTKSTEEASVLAMLCATGERHALLELDPWRLSRWLEVHRQFLNLGIEEQLRYSLASAWLHFLQPSGEMLPTTSAEIVTSSRGLGLADCVIDAQTASAMSALTTLDVKEALSAARQASLMAGSEGLPHQELLAYLVLARVRRLCGTPHLAARILRSLESVAPAIMQGWLGCELLLAGAPFRNMSLPESRAFRALEALAHVMNSALRGLPREFQSAASEVLDATSGFDGLRAEVADLLVFLSPSIPLEWGSLDAQEWALGQNESLPHGLHAVVNHGRTEGQFPPPVGYVLASPQGHGRRILSLGRSFTIAQNTPLLDREPRPRERTHTAISTLALAAQEPIDIERFFAKLYGFEYETLRHRPVFDTLLHRVRQRVGDSASLSLSRGQLTFVVSTEFLVWDPRCESTLTHRVLDILAASGTTTAREIAERVGVPLRTVQASLSDLVSSEACMAHRRGRAMEYVIEDTVFSEITRNRFRSVRT